MMSLGVVFRIWYLRIFDHLRRVEHSKTKTDLHQVLYRCIDLAFGDKSVFNGLYERGVFRPTRKIGAAFDSEGRGLCLGFGKAMAFPNVSDRPAIRDNMPGEVPFFKESVTEFFVGTSWLTVSSVIRAHQPGGLPFDDRFSKGRQVSFLEVPFAYDGVE